MGLPYGIPTHTQQLSRIQLDTFSGTASAVGTSTQVEDPQSNIHVSIKGLSTETVAITFTEDNSNFSAAITPLVASTGLPASSSNLGNGDYVIPIRQVESIRGRYKFTKSSTTDTVFVAVAVSKGYRLQGNPS